jgi:SAM-dependent methyltransferase
VIAGCTSDKALDHPPDDDVSKQYGHWNPDLIGDYDRIADLYAEAYADDLSREPFDQALLDRFAERVQGPVCDLGCGPAMSQNICLRLRGVEIFRIDLSPRMIDVARRRYPAIPFQVGDLRALDLPTDSVRGIVAFYSIIHFRRDAVVPDTEPAELAGYATAAGLRA